MSLYLNTAHARHAAPQANQVDRQVQQGSRYSPPPSGRTGKLSRYSPAPRRPFGDGLVPAKSLPTPVKRDGGEDCGAYSPSARNGKPADAVSDLDKADWIAMCAEREAKTQARETVAEWREESSRREIMNEINLTCSRYEISANLSGFLSEW